eukprot:CAMPEP_0178978110 /NCGR_PEP_ID=MMETSP0789-20121207/24937_1 /TAXON_ID=3005 /ORGANISM="Rhizosolenia setigera, Strain CCMP 1694" /LENGTH=133 /DNA_ID=CAMNT_0020667733 /DNA_START=284 /DNA_END=685 /DNA_ORIENTATION=-
MNADAGTLSLHAQANFTRGELAKAIRKGPYQVNVLLGGYDVDSDESALYWLDYMGTLQKVNYGAQGYASNFTLSIMDRDYQENLTEKEAVAIVEKCMNELNTRFLINQTNFIIKVVDKDGIKVVREDGDTSDN